VIFVTHHPEDARKIAENLVFLENGKVSASGRAADFFGSGGPQAFRDYIGLGGAAR
jgi:thiamine transport system ATP-binding protein